VTGSFRVSRQHRKLLARLTVAILVGLLTGIVLAWALFAFLLLPPPLAWALWFGATIVPGVATAIWTYRRLSPR
jgi:hypothetical protein